MIIEDGVTVMELSRCVRKALHGIDLWLVGSAARLVVMKLIRPIKDLDFVVPEKARYGLEIMDQHATEKGCPFGRTGFGGYKIEFDIAEIHKIPWQDGKVTVDIWPIDTGSFLRQAPTAWDGIAIHVATGMILKTPEFDSPFNFEIKDRWTRKPKYRPYYIEHLNKQGIQVKQ